MKPKIFILFLSLIVTPVAMANAALDRFEQLYGEFLSSYWHEPVTINGIHTTAMDYAAIWRSSTHSKSLYRKLIRAIAEIRPEKLDRRQAEAFWINAYNIGALRLVVDHYPVPSIRSFKISWKLYPWSKNAIQIRGQWYTLAAIEKQKLLERFGDPRILFAINCASISCPDQPPHPYSADKLEQQLDTTLRHFLANPSKGLRLDRSADRILLSWIFKKDRGWFMKDDNALIDFLKPYLDAQTLGSLSGRNIEIQFLAHDWTLNDWVLRSKQ